MRLKVGANIPSALLYEDGMNEVNIEELCRGKRVMIVGVIAAFSPECSEEHLPEFISSAEMIKSKGIDEIVCVSVNDVFVMEAWSRILETEGKIRMLADPEGNFTKAIGLQLDKTADMYQPIMGNIRSCRYNMIVIDGLVEKLEVEPEETGLSCTVANQVVGKL